MNKLTEYKRNGFSFQLVKRIGGFAFFHGKRKDINAYEVIKIQSNNGRTIAGKSFPPSEFPPSNEQWGTYGWSFLTLTKAFDFLNKKGETQ